MAYGARLESVLGASPRGFESPILRHHESAADLRYARSAAFMSPAFDAGWHDRSSIHSRREWPFARVGSMLS